MKVYVTNIEIEDESYPKNIVLETNTGCDEEIDNLIAKLENVRQFSDYEVVEEMLDIAPFPAISFEESLKDLANFRRSVHVEIKRTIHESMHHVLYQVITIDKENSVYIPPKDAINYIDRFMNGEDFDIHYTFGIPSCDYNAYNQSMVNKKMNIKEFMRIPDVALFYSYLIQALYGHADPCRLRGYRLDNRFGIEYNGNLADSIEEALK